MRPKKRLGQHFLMDRQVVESVVAAAELDQRDTVIEVGPGLGILTRRLADLVGRLIAVEIDPRLARALGAAMGSRPNVELVLGDILKLSPKELLGGRSGELCLPYKVVANLPYYITSPVLRHFLWSARKPSLMVVMVQKEVGEAIAATEGKQSLLALMVHLFSRPTIVRRVPARSFRPPPRVNSVVLRLDVRQEPAVSVPDIEGLFQVIRAGFSSPRKQLRNSLAVGLGLPTNDTVTLLSRAGIVQTRRAETLSLDEWKRLWEVWSSLGEVHLASGEGPGQDQPST